MLRNYLKVALRGMRRHLVYSVINVLGLSLGLIAGLMILLWVQDELSYDQSLPDADRIYRVMRIANHGEGQISTTPSITARLDDVLVPDYPEIEIGALQTWDESLILGRDDRTYRESGRHAGSDYLRLFQHPMLAGSREQALTDPNSIVLTEKLARKYFPEKFGPGTAPAAGATAVIGQPLRLDNRIDLTVTAVIEDLPANQSTRFDYLIPMEEYRRRNDWMDGWANNGARMFVRLAPDANPDTVSAKIRLLVKQNSHDTVSELFLQPYTDVYLKSKFENGVLVGGRIDYVRMFALIGIFVLLIAAINFMNLATARSAQRALEIGIRKAFGGSRLSLAGQFLSESVVTTLLAFVIAVVAVWLLLPSFNNLTGKSIAFRASDPVMWLQFLGVTLATGLLAGLYPAIYLSGVRLMNVLRKGVLSTGQGAALRRGLVVVQFAISVVLIVGTITVYRQLDYIRNQNLGLDRNNVFYSELEGAADDQYDSFRNRLLAEPGIIAVAKASENPIDVNISTTNVQWANKREDDKTLYYVVATDYDFVSAMKMTMAEGRTFSREFGADSSAYVINETAARAMGLENPVGQPMTLWGTEGPIVGVVKDFNMRSMYQEIEPLIFRLAPADRGFLFVRSAPGQERQAVASFEDVFREFNPEYPLEYTFLDTEFEQTYRSESVIGTLVNYFAGMAIVVACLGLFGLAAFTAERRTKEIGIRKVLGGSVAHVVALLSREFLVFVAIGFGIGMPIAYYFMSGWLDEFVYHTTIGWGTFLMAGLGMLVVAGATVGFQALRAATANPAVSLRAE